MASSTNTQEKRIFVIAAALVVVALTVFAVQWSRRGQTETVLFQPDDRATDIQPGDAPQIQLEQLARRMADEPDLFVLDVQEREGFLSQHIPGSVNIPFEEITAREAEIPRNRDVIVSCIGNEVLPCALSTKAANLLRSNGYMNIYDYRGGVTEWKAAGLPVVTNQDILVRAVTVDELKTLIDDRQDVLIVDVRDVDAYREEHIPSATQMPFDRLQESLIRLPRTKPIYVYAQTDGRAKLFVDELVRKGYIQVAYVVGGVVQWRASGYDLVSTQ